MHQFRSILPKGPSLVAQKGVRTERKIEILGVRVTGPIHLVSDDPQQVAVRVVDRPATVSRTDRRGELERAFAVQPRNQSITQGEEQTLRMTNHEDRLADCNRAVIADRLAELGTPAAPRDPEQSEIEPVPAYDIRIRLFAAF